jgi:3-dehydroquinate synthetase
MGQDKKRAGGKIRFVLPRALGDVMTVDSPGEEYILRALEYVLA